MNECYVRGSTIKYLRIPDEVIDMVKEENTARMKAAKVKEKTKNSFSNFYRTEIATKTTETTEVAAVAATEEAAAVVTVEVVVVAAEAATITKDKHLNQPLGSSNIEMYCTVTAYCSISTSPTALLPFISTICHFSLSCNVICSKEFFSFSSIQARASSFTSKNRPLRP